jgi:hypothetical protein
MAQNETKLMHYVPRAYLRKFTTNNKTIFGIRKKNNELFNNKVDNVCAKKFLYKIEGETEEERQIVEKFYNTEIESTYPEIYATLTDEHIVSIDNVMRKKIISFIISLFYRNYSWYKGFSGFTAQNLYMDIKLSNNDLIKKHMDDCNITEAEINSIIIGAAEKVSKEETKEIFNKEHIKAFDNLLNLRLTDNIFVKRIEGDYELVTSDSPVIMRDKENSHVVPFNLNNTIILPIDSKHYVKLMHNDSNLVFNEIIRNNSNGDKALMDSLLVNISINNNSNYYVLGTENGIRKFQDMRSHFKIPE